MADQQDYSGAAALAICEAIILALNDHKVLPETEIIGVLRDAANAHKSAHGGDMNMHRSVSKLIDAMIAGGNFVRRV